MFSAHRLLIIGCVCNFSLAKIITSKDPNELIHSTNQNVVQGTANNLFSDDPTLNSFFITFLDSYYQEFQNKNSSEVIDSFATEFIEMVALFNHTLKWYNDSMEKSIEAFENLTLIEREILALHKLKKSDAIALFSIGAISNKLKPVFQSKLEHSIDDSFVSFQRANKRKREHFISFPDNHIETIFSELMAFEIAHSDSYLDYIELNSIFSNVKRDTLKKIYAHKMDDEEFLSEQNRRKFHESFNKISDDFQAKLLRLLTFYNEYFGQYNNLTQELLASLDPCAYDTKFQQQHDQMMESTLEKFSNKLRTESEFTDKIKESFQHRLKNYINKIFLIFKQEYANMCNQIIINDPDNVKYVESIIEIKMKFEKKILDKIHPQADLSYLSLNSAFNTYKICALNEFESIKFDNENISKIFLTNITIYFNAIQTSIIQASDAVEKSMEYYRDSMERSIDSVRSHLTDNDFLNKVALAKQLAIANLLKIHQQAKQRSLQQFNNHKPVDSFVTNQLTEVLIGELDRIHSILLQFLIGYENCLENSENNSKLETIKQSLYSLNTRVYMQVHEQILDESAKQAALKQKCKDENNKYLSLKFEGNNASKIFNITVNLFKQLVMKTKKYHLQTNFQVDWHSAYTFCLYHNMRLASFSSQEESKQAEQQIRDAGFESSTFWTAGTKMGNNNEFYWMGHDKPFTFTNWGGNEPNDWDESENCIEMVEYFDLKWNDFKCGYQRYFICEE